MLYKTKNKTQKTHFVILTIFHMFYKMALLISTSIILFLSKKMNSNNSDNINDLISNATSNANKAIDFDKNGNYSESIK